MNEVCRKCIVDKYGSRCPSSADASAVSAYQETVHEIVEDTPTGPEAAYRIRQIRERLFGEKPFDYSEIKHQYNSLLLEAETKLKASLSDCEDRIRRAMQYAMTGNFIDFGALDSVTEEQLWELMGKAEEILFDESIYRMFRRDIDAAKRLTYITDNCGEIVLDKILIEELKKENPDLEVTIIVRGAPVANDATMEDALQIGMDRVGTVIGNGTDVDGTVLTKISSQAFAAVSSADVLIAKGQANYETLSGSGLPLYYLFMCKCALFMERFQVPQFSGILTREHGTAALLKK